MIYRALEALANSQDGDEIAQGLIDIGQTMTKMDVDETIAFRTSLKILVKSGQVEKGTNIWNMLDTLWRETEQHLIVTCGDQPTREIVGKVNLTLGRPYPCKVDDR